MNSKKTKGVASGGHVETVRSAKLILEAGGNAFDAAIAALLTTFVSEPCMSSPGGGGFMCAMDARRKPHLLDFFCQTPKRKFTDSDPDFYPVTISFESTTEDFHVGLGSVAVPGSIAGAFAMHERFGTLPFKELAAPAIELAKNGVEVDYFQRHDFELLEPILAIDEYSRKIYFPDGKHLINEGQTIYMPGMADLLEVLSIEGEDLFYKGEFAQEVAKVMENRGGFLRRNDFEDYKAIWRKPLSFKYGDYHVYTNPPPSAGGALILFVLDHLQNCDEHGVTEAHRFLNRLLDAYQIRKDPQKFRAYLKMLSEVKEIPKVGEVQKQFNTYLGSTTHFNIMDAAGNAVAISTTNGEGSAYVLPGTDVMLNNMLGEAALFPDGFHSWKPDTRVGSVMSPTVVEHQSKDIQYLTGTGGAGRIPMAISRVLQLALEKGVPIEEAILAPRMYLMHDELNMEPGLEMDFLTRQDHFKIISWDKLNMFFGGTHTIYRNGKEMRGIGDPRRNGTEIST